MTFQREQTMISKIRLKSKGTKVNSQDAYKT